MSLITVAAEYHELSQLFDAYAQHECPDDPWSTALEQRLLRDIRDVLEAVLIDADRLGFYEPTDVRHQIDTVLESESWDDTLKQHVEDLAIAVSMKADSYIQHNEFIAIVPATALGTLLIVIAPYS